MAAAATAPSRHVGHERRTVARRPACRAEPGRATLDDRITAVWSRLVETGMAECPVCSAEIAAGHPCAGCGSELS